MMHGVVILESEQMLASLVELWVESQPDLRALARCDSRQQALESQTTWGQNLGLLVCGTKVGVDDGITLAADLVDTCGRAVPVVVLAHAHVSGETERMRNRFGSGWAMVSRTHNGTRHLRQAVDAALEGMVMVDPVFTRASSGGGALASLTPQERGVLAALARGLSNQAIAEDQFTSVKSVERLIGSVYAKLGLDPSAKNTNPRVLATLRYRNLEPE